MDEEIEKTQAITIERRRMWKEEEKEETNTKRNNHQLEGQRQIPRNDHIPQANMEESHLKKVKRAKKDGRANYT